MTTSETPENGNCETRTQVEKDFMLMPKKCIALAQVVMENNFNCQKKNTSLTQTQMEKDFMIMPNIIKKSF